MRCTVKVSDIETINEIEGVWSDKDYIELLDRMSIPDAEKIPAGELREFLFMAIGDFEPEEAAEIILSHRLSNFLSKGQIKNLSVEMMNDKVAEEYSDVSLHFPLFNVNQLLYKAYNGTFPNTKASRLKLELEFHPGIKDEISKEIVLKALCNGLSDHNLIKRLYAKQLSGELEFHEAEHIIWQMQQSEEGIISLITSDYWINEDDLPENEFEGIIHEYEND